MGLKNVLIAHNKILTNLNLTAMGAGVNFIHILPESWKELKHKAYLQLSQDAIYIFFKLFLLF
jgi:hypothetical protein